LQIKFGPVTDSFGYNSLRSFIDHVDYYQSVQSILYDAAKIKFEFGKEGIPVYDIFEFRNDKKIEFSDINVIVVETFRQFKTIIDLLDKSKEYIIFSESFWNVNKYDFGMNYQLIYMPWDVVDCQNRLANRSSLYFHLLDLNFFSNYSPKYKFLCLAGRSKNWRDTFINKLKSQCDLSDTLTSYYGNCLGDKSLIELDLPYDRSSSKLEFENKFYQPIQVPDTTHKYNLSYFTKNELFYLSKFSVIVETEAELEEYHITEKTLKCLMLGHPFVVIGTPGYLKFLHGLGFTTCNELFDESYDSIIDLDNRMDAVIKLTKHLCDQNFDVNKLKEIQEKNLNALIRLRDADIYKKFLDLFNRTAAPGNATVKS
jgi:hypothetical protein